MLWLFLCYNMWGKHKFCYQEGNIAERGDGQDVHLVMWSRDGMYLPVLLWIFKSSLLWLDRIPGRLHEEVAFKVGLKGWIGLTHMEKDVCPQTEHHKWKEPLYWGYGAHLGRRGDEELVWIELPQVSSSLSSYSTWGTTLPGMHANPISWGWGC